MLKVFRDSDSILVVDSNDNKCEIIFGIESRYGSVHPDRYFTLANNDEMLQIYNQIGKLLGYPETKEQNV